MTYAVNWGYKQQVSSVYFFINSDAPFSDEWRPITANGFANFQRPEGLFSEAPQPKCDCFTLSPHSCMRVPTLRIAHNSSQMHIVISLFYSFGLLASRRLPERANGSRSGVG